MPGLPSTSKRQQVGKRSLLFRTPLSEKEAVSLLLRVKSTSDLPRTRTGRIWTYVGDDKHPYTVYDDTPTRSRDGPEEFLKAFRGYLQADAYSGYDRFYEEPERGIEEVACWAHYPEIEIIR